MTKSTQPGAVQTNGFVLRHKGDPSVGIAHASFELRGDFHFDSSADLDEFKTLLADAFEIVVDGRVDVNTLKEEQDQLAQEAPFAVG